MPDEQVVGEEDFGAETKILLERYGPVLLKVAASAIGYGLAKGKAQRVDVSSFPPELRETGACFVTLKKGGQLRGCIGSPQAHRPLVEDVSINAYSAAFRDPRFPALKAEEVSDLQLSISVLSPQAPMAFDGEEDFLAKLRPRVDGLVIADGGRRALFLPSVWEQIPDPQQFVGHLKVKAGMPADHWSENFQAWRFVAEEVYARDLPDPDSIWNHR